MTTFEEPRRPTNPKPLRPEKDTTMTTTRPRHDAPDPPPIAELALAAKCPACRAERGEPCRTKLARGYHIQRGDRGVARDRRARYGAEKNAHAKITAQLRLAAEAGVEL